MSIKDTKEYLSPITIHLHWIVAAFMIFLTALGIYMEEVGAENLFDLHISLGTLILIFVLPRIIWRIQNGWPEAAGHYTTLEHLSGKIVHWVLIIATLLMPISGVMMAIAGGHGLHFFGLELVAESIDPNNPEEVIVLAPLLANLGDSIHGIGGNVLPVAIGLHIVGALKHHLIDKDRTLTRMLSAKKH